MATELIEQRLHHLTCCVCGDDGGRFEQWHNRDTGYGLCAACRDWLTTPDPRDGRIRCDAAEMLDLYGEAGRHYAAKET